MVAIRDGMLATETVRQSTLRTAEGEDEDGQPASDGATHHETFEELVVLDRAGRVHIPPEILEQLNIGRRARLEVTEAGILIRPVVEVTAEVEQTQVAGSETEQQGKKPGRWQAIFGRRTPKKDV